MKISSVNILLFIFFLNLFNPLLNSFLRGFGLMGFMTIIRDTAILLLFMNLIVKRLNYKIINSIVMFFLFILFYVITSITQSELLIGIYFSRVYSIPILFIWIASIYFESGDVNIDRVIRSILRISVLSGFTSIIIVITYYFNDELINKLFTLRDISGSWFVGYTFFRAGWPIGGPNQLGIFSASMTILSIIVLSKRIHIVSKRLLLTSLILNFTTLLLTFSRSSWLFFLGFLVGYLVLSAKNKRLVLKTLTIFLLGLPVLIWYVKNNFDKLHEWILSSLHLTELSTSGHIASLRNAVINFNEYFLLGYPRGTVGPRAIFFYGNIHNVENTFILWIMEFGIFGFLLYISSLFYVLSNIVKTQIQFLYLLALLIPLLLLPYSQDIETLILISTFVVLFGKLKSYSGNKTFNHQTT